MNTYKKCKGAIESNIKFKEIINSQNNRSVVYLNLLNSLAQPQRTGITFAQRCTANEPETKDGAAEFRYNRS